MSNGKTIRIRFLLFMNRMLYTRISQFAQDIFLSDKKQLGSNFDISEMARLETTHLSGEIEEFLLRLSFEDKLALVLDLHNMPGINVDIPENDEPTITGTVDAWLVDALDDLTESLAINACEKLRDEWADFYGNLDKTLARLLGE